MSEWLTTEEVVERLDTTAQVIYETRRRNQYPGKLGHRRGRRLMFDSTELQDWLETVPAIERNAAGVVVGWATDPAYGADDTTNEGATAILWALQGIHTTLRAIHNELRKGQRFSYPDHAAALVDMWVNGDNTGDESEGCEQCSQHPWSRHYVPGHDLGRDEIDMEEE